MSEYPSTRKEAQRLGYRYYYTGKPCKHGHDSLRTTHNRDCTECDKNRCRERYRDNRERYLSKRRERYRNDPKFRERYLRLKRERRKERYHNDPEFRERYLRLHRERGKERYHNDIEFRARCNATKSSREKRCRRQTPAWANFDRIKAVYAEAQRLTDETGIPHEVDHVYPVKGKTVSGLHTAENLQVLPMSENRSKNNANPDTAEPAR